MRSSLTWQTVYGEDFFLLLVCFALLGCESALILMRAYNEMQIRYDKGNVDKLYFEMKTENTIRVIDVADFFSVARLLLPLPLVALLTVRLFFLYWCDNVSVCMEASWMWLTEMISHGKCKSLIWIQLDWKFSGEILFFLSRNDFYSSLVGALCAGNDVVICFKLDFDFLIWTSFESMPIHWVWGPIAL